MIRVKHIRPGFDQIHFNMDSEEPWPVHPVLHHIWTADGDEYHDHPHDLTLWVLSGELTEQLPDGAVTFYRAGDLWRIKADRRHRIMGVNDFWAMAVHGPTIREWRMYSTEEACLS